MATKVWQNGTGDWFSSSWLVGGIFSAPPTAGDTATIEGGVTITAVDATVSVQGTLDQITIDFVKLGGTSTLAPVLDV
ncbi:MAG TPA: hypothetical protein VFN46_01770, partial [Acetobacteraceae bacterium]|nr:hypothetical protein [Acetobacteraceae bacterium]